MIKTEVSEIKRKMADCISNFGIAYINQDKEAVISYERSAARIPEEIFDHYMLLLKKVLSGKVDATLLNLSFPAEEEKPGGRQVRLLNIVKNGFGSGDAFAELCESIASSFVTDGNFMILIARGAYDVPAKRGGDRIDADMDEDVYSFMICAVCPVTPVSPGLCYDTKKKDFIDHMQDWVVGKPEAGFLFPSFTDRCADVHGCLYSVKKASELQKSFVSEVFGCDIPSSAEEQMDLFAGAVSEALGSDADVELVSKITRNIAEYVAEREAEGEPSDMNTAELNHILQISGTKKQVEEDINIKASNIAQNKYVFEGDGIKLIVTEDMIDLLAQEVINGVPRLTLPMSGLVLNGIPVSPA